MTNVVFILSPYLIVFASVAIAVRAMGLFSERMAEYAAAASFLATNLLFGFMMIGTGRTIVANATDLLALWVFIFLPVSVIASIIVFVFVTSSNATKT